MPDTKELPPSIRKAIEQQKQKDVQTGRSTKVVVEKQPSGNYSVKSGSTYSVTSGETKGVSENKPKEEQKPTTRKETFSPAAQEKFQIKEEGGRFSVTSGGVTGVVYRGAEIYAPASATIRPEFVAGSSQYAPGVREQQELKYSQQQQVAAIFNPNPYAEVNMSKKPQTFTEKVGTFFKSTGSEMQKKPQGSGFFSALQTKGVSAADYTNTTVLPTIEKRFAEFEDYGAYFKQQQRMGKVTQKERFVNVAAAGGKFLLATTEFVVTPVLKPVEFVEGQAQLIAHPIKTGSQMVEQFAIDPIRAAPSTIAFGLSGVYAFKNVPKANYALASLFERKSTFLPTKPVSAWVSTGRMEGISDYGIQLIEPWAKQQRPFIFGETASILTYVGAKRTTNIIDLKESVLYGNRKFDVETEAVRISVPGKNEMTITTGQYYIKSKNNLLYAESAGLSKAVKDMQTGFEVVSTSKNKFFSAFRSKTFAIDEHGLSRSVSISASVKIKPGKFALYERPTSIYYAIEKEMARGQIAFESGATDLKIYSELRGYGLKGRSDISYFMKPSKGFDFDIISSSGTKQKLISSAKGGTAYTSLKQINKEVIGGIVTKIRLEKTKPTKFIAIENARPITNLKNTFMPSEGFFDVEYIQQKSMPLSSISLSAYKTATLTDTKSSYAYKTATLTDTKSLTRYAYKTATLTNTKSLYDTKTRYGVRIDVLIKVKTLTKSAILVKTAQMQDTAQITKTTTKPNIPFNPPNIPITPFPRINDGPRKGRTPENPIPKITETRFKFNFTPPDEYIRRKKKKQGTKSMFFMPFRYTSSLQAVTFNIRGKRPKLLSGVELRPLRMGGI